VTRRVILALQNICVQKAPTAYPSDEHGLGPSVLLDHEELVPEPAPPAAAPRLRNELHASGPSGSAMAPLEAVRSERRALGSRVGMFELH